MGRLEPAPPAALLELRERVNQYIRLHGIDPNRALELLDPAGLASDLVEEIRNRLANPIADLVERLNKEKEGAQAKAARRGIDLRLAVPALPENEQRILEWLRPTLDLVIEYWPADRRASEAAEELVAAAAMIGFTTAALLLSAGVEVTMERQKGHRTGADTTNRTKPSNYAERYRQAHARFEELWKEGRGMRKHERDARADAIKQVAKERGLTPKRVRQIVRDEENRNSNGTSR